VKPLLTFPASRSSTPSFATPNDHRFGRSLEAKLKQFQFDCQAIKNACEIAEDQADANVGTPAAACDYSLGSGCAL